MDCVRLTAPPIALQLMSLSLAPPTGGHAIGSIPPGRLQWQREVPSGRRGDVPIGWCPPRQSQKAVRRGRSGPPVCFGDVMEEHPHTRRPAPHQAARSTHWSSGGQWGRGLQMPGGDWWGGRSIRRLGARLGLDD
ncbi:hypothetical protein chiPu_0010242 [Chiloscyllium punctatum]|uniref:Uncharacterized protein n=1 Tax=Chiloscyllium punctatum TaxID=137246 RepID=A0A401SN47_CHIPU|nr:hypothetical protein [Chiloscyllium punctatum]